MGKRRSFGGGGQIGIGEGDDSQDGLLWISTSFLAPLSPLGPPVVSLGLGQRKPPAKGVGGATVEAGGATDVSSV